MFKVGDRVRILKNIIEGPDEDHPTLQYAAKGDLLIVRDIARSPVYPYRVSHEDVLDSTFRVSEEEIELVVE